jgi:hypothetical protein
MKESLPFQSTVPVILFLGGATMAYIQYNYDRLIKKDNSTIEKLESLDKSMVSQIQSIKNLYDETLESTSPEVIAWYTTKLLFAVFYLTALAETVMILWNIINEDVVFSNLEVGGLLILQLAFVVIAMTAGIWKLKKLDEFVKKREDNFTKICEHRNIFSDALDSTKIKAPNKKEEQYLKTP